MNNGKQTTEQSGKINKTRVKKGGKNKKLRFLIIILVVLALVFIIANWRTVFAPFEDIMLRHGKGGFPVSLPGSTQYCLGELGDNFYLLTDTYLYTYTKDGAEIAGIQHGFQNPAGASNDRRVLVYDKNGKAFRLYSRTGEVFTNTVDDVIVFGQIGNTERSAVVTTSTRYSNYLCVFNGEGRQIFRWASPDEKIMGVCFGPKDNCIYVSVIGEMNGELLSSIVKFDLSVSESEIWRTSLGERITYSLKLCGNTVYAVTGTGALMFDEQTGEVKSSNSFVWQINDIPEPDGMKAVIFRDSATNKKTVVTYDDELVQIGSITPEEDITACDVYAGRLYLLMGSSLSVYDDKLKEIKTYELDDEYSDLKAVGKKVYLLGYNTVQCLKL